MYTKSKNLLFFTKAILSPCVDEGVNGGYVLNHGGASAHSGSHGRTRGLLRVDGDDVFGSGIIDTIGPFHADQTVSVALAE